MRRKSQRNRPAIVKITTICMSRILREVRKFSQMTPVGDAGVAAAGVGIALPG
jgi:hypothetical protein